MYRRKLGQDIEARLLTEVRRRCCLCVFLERDWDVKQVQIAHISRIRSDNRYSNLALLCIPHHDQYDSRPSQSKGYTPTELKHCKSRLIEAMRGFGEKPVTGSPLADVAGSPLQEAVVGLPEHTTRLPQTQIPDEIAQMMFAGFNDRDAAGAGSKRHVTVQAAPGGARIVGLTDDNQWGWRSYVLTPNGSNWRVQGPIETFTKGDTPHWKYVNGTPFSLLSVSQVMGTGTGIFLRGNSYYRVGDNGVVLLFTYPTFGYVNGWVPFARDIRSTTVEPKSELLDEHYKIDVSYKIEYRADPSLPQFRNTPLFNVEARLRLQWDADSGMMLTRPGSTSLAQVEDFFNGGSEEFLNRYERQLLRIARTGRPLQRRWLSHFLTAATDSPARRRIARGLGINESSTGTHRRLRA